MKTFRDLSLVELLAFVLGFFRGRPTGPRTGQKDAIRDSG